MKIYVLSPKAIERAKHKALIRGMILLGFSVTVALLAPLGAGLMPVAVLVIVAPITLVALITGIRRGVKLLDENLKSYKLLVSADSVVKKQDRFPDVEIHRGQITTVEEKTGIGLFIRTADKKSFINVPEGLEGINELKETLSTWLSPGSIISSKGREPLLLMMALLPLWVAFATVWLSKNPALVTTAGIFLIVYMIYGAVILRGRPDIDSRAKLKPWLIVALVFVYAAMLYGRISFLLKH